MKTGLIRAMCMTLACSAASTLAEPVPHLVLATNHAQHGTYPDATAMVKRAFAKAGIALTVKPLPAKRALRMARKGHVDGVLARSAATFQNELQFVKIDVPVYTLKLYAFIDESSPCYKNYEELRHKVPVALLGIKYFEHIERSSRRNMETVQTLAQAGQMVQMGRAYYFVAPEEVEEKIEFEASVKLKKCGTTPFKSITTFTFLHSKYKHLIPKLEKAYIAAKNDSFTESAE